VAPDVDAAGPVGAFRERALHGLGQQRSQVVYGGPALDFQLGKVEAIWPGDHHAEVMRCALCQRLWQRPEVRFPGLILLRQALEAALHEERRAFAQLQLLSLFRHDHFLLNRS
jgi:hypothetical protein